ncbi:MAG TPA: ABC transporter permease [Chloroflexota bacterium]|nr:ABC transporter permease [Chloroflexota bacterium]
MRRNRAAMIGLVVLIVVAAAAAAAPLIAPYEPTLQETGQSLKPGFWAGNERNLLGTDLQGRDILSRLIYGARISVAVGLTAVAISALIGVLAGLVAGFYAGRVGDGIMRVADIQLSFPAILLALALVGILGPSAFNVVLVLGVTGWVVYARVVRGRVLSVKETEFIAAAHAIGARDPRIIFRHVLPNVMTPVIVLATLEVATVIIAEATLSFLGVGIQPPTPTWGGMLADGKLYLRNAWWVSTIPGVTITVVVLSINLLGDWLRDTLDPRFRLAS